MHLCSFWQGTVSQIHTGPHAHTQTHTSSHMHVHVNLPAHTTLPTSHPETAWHLSQQEGLTHTHSHSEAQTQLCCLQRVYPFDPLTGTRRISKREEKPRSRSTSQSCALSIGSCRTAGGSGDGAPLPGSHNSPLRKWGVSGALSTSLRVRSRRIRGQTSRGPLYHVLCMTCGMCLNIYMCLKVMQIVRKTRGRSSENSASFCQQSLWVNSVMQCRSSTCKSGNFPIYWSASSRCMLTFWRLLTTSL